MDIGSELRSARIRRALSIEQLAELTKIRHSQLRAIERNEFDRLPGTIYARAFLKAYAREVGLNPDDVAARFSAAFEQAPRVESDDRPGVLASMLESLARGRATAVAMRWPYLAGAFLLVWMYASYAAFIRTDSSAPATSDAIGVGTSDVIGSDPISRAVETSGTAAGSAGSLNSPLRSMDLEIHTTGVCWVSLDADGKRVIRRLMAAGERQRIEVREAAILRIGDPAAFRFSINDVPGRPLGEAGRAITVQITPENVSNFVARLSKVG